MEDANKHKLIEYLRDSGKECEWIEFKENKYNPEAFGIAISALSNGAAFKGKRCAYLVYGIEDETLRITGTSFDPYKMKKGNEDIYSWVVNRISPKFDFTVIELEQHGERLVVIEIPAATSQPTKFVHKAYVRVGPNNRPLTEFPDTERALWQNINNFSFESGIALSHISEAQVFALLDIETFYKLREEPLPRQKAKRIERFIKERYVLEGSGWYNITNLGAILFAVDLDSFPTIQRKAVRVIQYKGKGKSSVEKEQVGKKGYATGFEGLINYINERLPASEVIGKVVRKEIPQYPPEAIRELVANAIIHQDFSMQGTSVLVEIYTDRIEISNPGLPIVDPDKFINEAHSRNEVLAASMRKARICEERGSGIDLVFTKVEVYQLPSPEFKQKDTSFTVTLFAPKKLSKMTKKEKIRACYQHCCLKYVVNETMTNTSLRERFSIGKNSAAQASGIIDMTEKMKLIKPVDPESTSKKFAAYVPYWA